MSRIEATPPGQHQPPSARTVVNRTADRASYDRDIAYAILDAGMVAHVGISSADGPAVIPMVYARDGDRLLIHGSTHSRVMTHAASGNPLCVTVTLLDGVVLGRSQFRHSVNYRSVVVFGQAEAIEDLDERRAALGRLVEKLVPGRTTQPQPPRPPSEPELYITMLLSLPLEEFSVKQRTTGPADELPDYRLAVWAGVIPLEVTQGEPVPDTRMLDEPPEGGPPPVPSYVSDYQRS